MRMKDIYTKYFQKSATFLYPLLNIRKSKHPTPRQTYISWDDNVKKENKMFICLYDREDSDQWKRFEANILMTHPLLIESVIVSEDQVLYIFDFNTPEVSGDFDHFLNGKYSKFSNESKKLITDYFGIQSPEWIFIESYIHPRKYFSTYAEILNVDVESLQKVGELCDKYNSEKENCTVILINELQTAKN